MKRKSKPLKTLLKSSSIVIFLILFSCKNSCDKEFLKLLESVRNDNYIEIKKFLDNGGSPDNTCYDYRAGKFGSDRSLLSLSVQLEKLDLIKLMLHYVNTSDSFPKNRILKLALRKRDTLFIKTLIKDYNVHIYIIGHNDFINLDKIKLLKRANYNFDYIDSYGNTLLMDIINYSDIEEEELLELIQYFVEIGVKIDIKNKEGKTAYELATNPKIKAYLKSLKQ